ncbi:MORN-repeat protein [Orpheovirus IHUMI-LCC2]|uniref:MORN-repeat protein n=1 Tax=Orpheovirus IHUMI-LCC2 TaxID=2023057 RepID=A0A2I2L4J7_9VIRU|nr:MORN-repeat protein [Orpheovirus IHUMI-LCC2]SNW62454.1 MORN-repeat protein [Orpheovirus IHUMI-LCC2]
MSANMIRNGEKRDRVAVNLLDLKDARELGLRVKEGDEVKLFRVSYADIVPPCRKKIYSTLNGKKTGKQTNYYRNGQTKCISFWDNGKQNGRNKVWTATGSLLKEENYTDGKLDGVVTKYYVGLDNYQNSGWSNVKRNNTGVSFVGTYKNGVPDDVHRAYYKNGKLKFAKNYVNGKLSGTSKEWYMSGMIKTCYEFKDGKKDGTGYKFYKNGGVMREIEYTNGKKNGRFREYYYPTKDLYKNGVDFKTLKGLLKKEQEYKNDVPVGVHIEKDKYGKVVKSIEYDGLTGNPKHMEVEMKENDVTNEDGQSQSSDEETECTEEICMN